MTVGETIISVSNVSFVTFDGFNIDCARQTAISAGNGIFICAAKVLYFETIF